MLSWYRIGEQLGIPVVLEEVLEEIFFPVLPAFNYKSGFPLVKIKFSKCEPNFRIMAVCRFTLIGWVAKKDFSNYDRWRTATYGSLVTISRRFK